MPLPLVRYPLDPTGTNPDNRVVGEIHTLSARTVRAAAPLYGAYFTTSLLVYDHSTNRLLVRNVDYQCGELLQAASLRFGQELCLLVLVTNPAVSDQIRLTYQSLGGEFQHDASGIVTLYETAIQDTRAVDWTQVLNKPDGYVPALHRHLLDDVVGFEPVVNALERIRQAIILSDVPAFEAMIDWVDNRLIDLQAHMARRDNPHAVTLTQLGYRPATLNDVMLGTASTAVVTADVFLQAVNEFCFRSCFRLQIDRTDPPEGRAFTIGVRSTNVLDATRYYWSIEHGTTDSSDFAASTGSFLVQNNQARFEVLVLRDAENDAGDTFHVRVHSGSSNGPVVVRSNLLTVTAAGPDIFDSFNQLLMGHCLFSDLVVFDSETLFFSQSL